jgi:phosphate starvation-inducible PhoH-like protein
MQKKPTGTTRAKKTESINLGETKKTTDVLGNIKIEIKHKNETQKKLTHSIKTNDVTICIGMAGTGKTYLAVAEALKLLKANLGYKKIVLIKSVTTLKSEEIGFLKGSLEEKMEPFIYSFISNFDKLIGKENTSKLRELNYIETLPISYLRGISIDNAIILVDEIQNISHDNMKTILTRLGENSKMIFLGDVEQIDLKNKKDSSLSNLVNRIKNKPTNGVEVVEFGKEDIVRHKLTSYFIDLFEDEQNKS